MIRLKIGTKAATAALEEAKAEKAELQRQVADGALERDRLGKQIEELRDRLNVSEFRWRQLHEHSSAIDAAVVQGMES